jgi:hypothetical protein
MPEDIDFPAWIGIGRDLFARHRQTEWMLADWLRCGAERFAEEEQFALFLGEMGVDPKRAISDAKVARLIPPSWRSDRVSFEVCKQLAKIDDEPTRQRMLKRAVDEHWNERAAHHAVVEHKSETGQLLPDDDDTSRLSTEIVRCWNRAGPEAREYFYALAEMAAANGFGLIDQDMAI